MENRKTNILFKKENNLLFLKKKVLNLK